MKRVVISAGGTGGHLFPAQALASKLKEQSVDVLFVAGGLSTSRHFDREKYAFCEVTSAQILSKNPLKILRGIVHLARSVKQSLAILKKVQPDVVVGFGSYYTVPIVLAARWLKIPIVLHEANSIPGRANRYLSSFATHIGVHFPMTLPYFKDKARCAGLPLREGYSLCAVSKDKALDYFGLEAGQKTLLVFGGSQGAKSINASIKLCTPVFHSLSLQLIHLTGDRDTAEDLQRHYAEHGIRACVKVTEHRMNMAWRAADGFVGRSGASTIAEATEFEVPGILIPYPHATDNHQEINANFFACDVGAGKKILEKELTSERLSSAIEELFHLEYQEKGREAARKHKQTMQHQTLTDLVRQTAKALS